MTDPWIFKRIAAALAGEKFDGPTFEERRRLILTHFGWIVRDFETRLALHKLRTFTGRYTHGLPGGRKLRSQIGRLSNVEQFVSMIERHFDEIAAEGPAPLA